MRIPLIYYGLFRRKPGKRRRDRRPSQQLENPNQQPAARWARRFADAQK
jgi:hypothetical protein